MNHGVGFIIGPARLVDIIGVLFKSGRIHLAEVGVLGMVGRGFPDIVNTGPDELAKGEGGIPFRDDTGLRRPGAPTDGTVPQSGALFIIIGQQGFFKGKMVNPPALHDRPGLAPVDHPVGVLGVVLPVVFIPIIVAGDFHMLRAFLRILPRHVVGADGDLGVPLGVILTDIRRQHLCELLPSFGVRVGIIDLIANTPQQEAGVVPVPRHPAFYVLPGPFLEKPGVVIGGLGEFPHVKSLRDHQQPHLIGKIHELRGRHVVGGPDRVHPHLLQQLEPSAQGGFIKGGPQGPQVMVFTGPLQLDLLPVQEEAFVRVEDRLFEADAVGEGLNLLPPAVPCFVPGNYVQLGDKFIKPGVLRAPQAGVLHKELLPVGPAGIFPRYNTCRHGDLPAAVQEAVDQFPLLPEAEVRIDLHHPVVLPRLFLAGGDIDPVGFDIILPSYFQPDIPVDAGPRIPSAVGRLVDHLHQDLVLPLPESPGDLMLKGGITVFPFPHRLPVDIDRGIHVDPFEIKEDPAGLGGDKPFPVPANATFI